MKAAGFVAKAINLQAPPGIDVRTYAPRGFAVSHCPKTKDGTLETGRSTTFGITKIDAYKNCGECEFFAGTVFAQPTRITPNGQKQKPVAVAIQCMHPVHRPLLNKRDLFSIVKQEKKKEA